MLTVFNILFCFSGFKEYLETAPACDFPSYRQLVHNVTQTFNNISNEVITIESKLRESGQSNIADLIRKIQIKEKEKLEVVSLKFSDITKQWNSETVKRSTKTPCMIPPYIDY